MKKTFLSISIFLILIILTLGQTSLAANTVSNNTNQTQSNISKEEENELKSNKFLSSLEVEGYELLPEFNKNTLDYYVIIPNTTKSLDIQAKPEIQGAIVKIIGNTTLSKKENTITVRVTAINGTSRLYNITAIKEPEVNLQLESLEIEEINLSPKFDKDIYYYKLSLEDTELKSLNIKAKANDDSAEVEIIGSNNIVDGENLINIILTNSKETTIYQIDLDVDVLGEKEKEIDNVITRLRKIINYAIIGFIILIVLIIFIIIITIIVKRNKKNKSK